jgi:hypothetical protein
MNRHTALLLAALILSAVPPPGRAQSGTADAPGYRYLLKDVALTVDSDGQKTLVFRRQLEILRRDAVDEVGDISVPYNAFRSTARVLRAETRTADGRRLPVPKEDIRDLIPEDVQGYQMYDDVRQLTFSMPGLAPGAILDYEVEIRERRPVMPGQFWDTQFLDDYVPVATSRFVVTLPARREFAARAGGTGVASNEVVQGSRRVLTWERRDIPAVPWEFQGPPPEEYRTFVRLSSLTNWDTVGQWYAGVLAGLDWNAAPVREKAAQLVQGHTGDLARIQALYEFAAQDVRYVGVELGRSDFTPHPPAQTLKNMYGDCKDKAALLVALMRAAGLTGHVALVRPNQAGPLDHQAPHPNQFSHAIVHVPRPAGPLWIDATVPRQDVRTYGRYLDGGEPLVMSGRPGVIAVPALPPRPDIQRTRYEIRARPGGLCLVDVLHEWENQAAADQRARWEENALNRYEQQVRENLTNETGYTRALEIRPPNASALTAPLPARRPL